MNHKLEQIKILRKKKFTLNEIGAKLHPPITGERVRQILFPEKYVKCPKHKMLFLKECTYCKIEKEYPKQLKDIAKKGVIPMAQEFHRLSKKDRSKGTVIQRIIFVKYLKDKEKLSLSDISRLLARDYTSIVNLYSKKI